MKVAVYGTLKKGFHNHRVLELANGEFIKKSFVPFESIDSVGFPRVKFNSQSNKFLEVEIYEVGVVGVHDNLDSLEGFYGDGDLYNHYNRIKVNTIDGEEVSVYEINREIPDLSEDYFIKEEDNKLFYNWK